MFLEALRSRNAAFVKAAAAFHQAGELPASSFVLDLDAMEENASAIAQEAGKYGLAVYGMTKQFGRHPEAVAAVRRGGIEAFVAVDMACARALHAAGARIGHLGHLVQVPSAETAAALALGPDHWTLYSLDKARALSEACSVLGRRQKVLLRVRAEGDVFYRGHEGGFSAAEIDSAAEAVAAMPGLDLAGFTSFPALLFDEARGEVLPTHNLGTLSETARRFTSRLGRRMALNAPGTTSSAVVRVLAEAGATQIEPGHALTGSTPLHALRHLPERPAMLYLSEVSHLVDGDPFFFGGGLYVDPVFKPYPVRALVGPDPESLASTAVEAELVPDSSIDYYGILHPGKGLRVSTGDTVILGFRAQAFVTRAFVAGISGISRGLPKVEAIRDSAGGEVRWP